MCVSDRICGQWWRAIAGNSPYSIWSFTPNIHLSIVKSLRTFRPVPFSLQQPVRWSATYVRHHGSIGDDDVPNGKSFMLQRSQRLVPPRSRATDGQRRRRRRRRRCVASSPMAHLASALPISLALLVAVGRRRLSETTFSHDSRHSRR